MESREKSEKNHYSYAIIGFDSEFKSPGPIQSREVKEAKAKYKVLSYQFHVSCNGVEWSGVCIPKDGERMSLGEYITFALASGVRSGKKEKLPTKLYIVGHFSRADLPAFSDFKNFSKLLSNVRNSFITNRYIPLDLKFDDDGENNENEDKKEEESKGVKKEKGVRLQVVFRDTMLLVPGHSKSLKTIGEFLNKPKISLHPDPARERGVKRSMDVLRNENWELFRKYAINHSVLCCEFAKCIIGIHAKTTGQEVLAATLTSIGVTLLQKSWIDAGVNGLEILGREVVSEKRWDHKRHIYLNKKREVSIPDCFDNETIAIESYHGGRNEQYYFGVKSGAWLVRLRSRIRLSNSNGSNRQTLVEQCLSYEECQ